MPEITLIKAIELKRELEYNILGMINDFARITQIPIDKIEDISLIRSDDGAAISVHIDVKL